MALSRKNKRAAKKAAKQATSRVERFTDSAQRTAQGSLDRLQGAVVPAVSEGAKDVRKKTNELVDQYFPQVQDAVQAQGERIAHFTDNLGPRAERIRHDVRDDYLPRARRTAGATNAVVASAVAAAVEAARKELDKGQADIKKAYAKPTPKQRKRGAGKVLLLLTIAAAGGAAGYLAWKKTRPVEDPWAPPADFARAHYPASAANDTDSSEVSDTVGGAEAGDVARSLQGGTHAPSTSNTKDRIADTAPHDVKFDSASGAAGTGTAAGSSARTESARTDSGRADSSAGTHRGADLPDQGKVIDPVMNPEENPADPENRGGEQRGTHRGDA